MFRKTIEWTGTILCWLIFFSFLIQLPLSFVHWFLDISILKTILFVDFKEDVLRTINTLLIIAYFFIWLVIVWTMYNKKLYLKRKKHVREGNVSLEEVEHYFKLDKETINQLQTEKHTILDDTIV